MNKEIVEIKKALEKYNGLLETENREIVQDGLGLQRATDGLKEANWGFTEALFEKFEEIPQIVLENFLVVIGIKKKKTQDKEWMRYNFSEVKNILNAFRPENLKENQVDELFLIYNSKEIFRRYSNSQVIVDWMSFALEYKMYRDRVAETKTDIGKISKKIQDKINRIAKLEKKRHLIKNNLIGIKKYLSSEKSHTNHSSDTSKIISRNHSNSDIKQYTEGKTLVTSAEITSLRIDTDQIYKENTEKMKGLEISNITYESEHELKCCKLKGLCFI